MKDYSISLTADEDSALTRQAQTLNLSPEEMIGQFIRRALRAAEKLSWKAEKAWSIISSFNPLPGKKISTSNIIRLWPTSAPGATAEELVSGLNELESRGWLIGDNKTVEITEEGHEAL